MNLYLLPAFSLLALMFSAVYPKNTPVSPYEPVAVVELFTSQGCSSCPSADRLLRQTIDAAVAKNQRVFGLSFHVDYWDRLGWKDPFSSPQATERQRHYVRQMRLNSLYTPQAVVNGQQEFVGSSTSRMQTSLSAALARPATVRIEAEPTGGSGATVTLSYRLVGQTEGAVLLAALISKKGDNEVPRGENAGTRLSAVNAVRAFQSIAKPGTLGNLTLTAPAGFDRANGAVVLFVQAADGRVRGASEVSL